MRNYYNRNKMSNIQEETKLLVTKIVDGYKPEKVILFGSVARGETRRDADIDLLIVKKTDKKRPFRVKDVFTAIRGIDRRYALDPIVYTPEELERRASLGDYFIRRVLSEGKVLYG